MTNVFTYGSLMFEPVWSRVVTGNYQSQSATIQGFKRYAVIDQDFPVIVPGVETDTLRGVLYLNVSDENLYRLDAFESDFYIRETVSIAGKEKLQAQVYVLDPEYAHVASDKNWSPGEFERYAMEKFIERFG